MTMPADLSLMDFLFDREDPMNLPEKDSFAKSDGWPCNPDDFLDSLLKFEDIPFEILDDNEMFTLPDAMDMNVANSTCSDSGLSSDQQFSPMIHDADDEDGTDFLASTSGSEGSPNPHFDNQLDSPIKEEEIEIDSSVYDLSDTETLGDVIIEEGHDIDDMNVLPDFDEEMTVEQVKSNSGQKLIRVTPISGNPRSILLPVSLKDMKDIRSIKIFNSASRKASSKPVSSATSSAGSSKSSSISSEDESDAHYPRLQLTSEEKRLLQKEGVRLPTHYPLTKFEERELKRIRRKIRNKISAQDSRKRKKEYIDGLEDRVKQCTEENMSLVKKIKVLQSQNQTMMTQLKRLHAALSRGTAKTAQPATCLMVLMLSVALVMMPNLGANRGATDIQAETEITLPENDIPPIAGRSRTLLFSKPISEELCLPGETPESEELLVQSASKSAGHLMSDMDELLSFRRRHQDHDYGPSSKRPRGAETPTPVEYLSGSKGFIVPPIDDDWPPPPTTGFAADVADRVADYANEFKVNISDARGTRTVVLQVPSEK